MRSFEHACAVRYILGSNAYTKSCKELCVSDQHLWVRCKLNDDWRDEEFEAVRVILSSLIAINLLPPPHVKLPTEVPPAALHPYRNRLKSLEDVERALEIVSGATYRIECAVPDELLGLVDRLWFGGTEEGPFRKARRALADIETDLEGWSEWIDAEKVRLCREVLGVGPGDDVAFESRGKAAKMRLEGASVPVYADAVGFCQWGTRYRQDGRPGKRQEYFSLRVAQGDRK